MNPIPRTWKYKGPEVAGEYMKVKRFQLPLAPANALSLYSMQGMTADPGLIAHWVIPQRLTDDIKWLIVYVLLSRVRSLSRLRSVGLSNKVRSIIEGGPPAILAENFEKLFRHKIVATTKAAQASKAALGWA